MTGAPPGQTKLIIDPEVRAEHSISQRLARLATCYAERTAVLGEESEWSYAELWQRSNAIAAQIIAANVDNQLPVAILMDHSPHLIAAIVGTLTAGRIYLALDPSSSRQLLRAQAVDSRAQLLVADQTHAALARSLTCERVIIAGDAAPSQHIVMPKVSPHAGACLMYTSGSTGIPKGVWQNHRGVVHGADVYRELVGIVPDDRLSLLTSCTLSSSGSAIFGALLNGATLCPFDLKASGVERLAEWIGKHRITIYHSVPTVFRYLMRVPPDARMFETLRLIRLGGERIVRGDMDHFRRRFHDQCHLMNSFSSTETGLLCSWITDKQNALRHSRIPVGAPVPGIQLFLVDEQGRAVMPGQQGRIGVRSAYLRQGYWMRPKETAAKFRTDPSDPDKRFFVTNDLARFRPDGMLECLGRSDEMVKVGGIRANLSELEETLRATELVENAAVTAVKNRAGGNRLLAYIVPTRGSNGSLEATETALQRVLPVPCRFREVAHLPVLPSGKIDRAQLIRMTAESSRTLSGSHGDFRDTLDLQLLHLWENVLEVDSIGIRDNFFTLGGDSLAAAAVMAGVEKLFQLGLPITSLLEAPTIQQLSKIIRTAGAGKIDPHLIALRLGTKAPLFCVPSAGSNAFEFRFLASNLDENQPVFVFQAPGLDGRSCCPRSVEEMADCYVRAMRVYQPIGPYFLCGNSFGGVVAFAMAKQLVADGDKIALLAVLDSHAGEYPKRRRRLKAKARIKFALLRFLPKPGGYSFDAASFKRGTQEWLKRCLIRRLIAAERLARRRLLQCSKKVRELYVQELCFAARKRYRPNAFCGTLHLFRTLSEPPLDMFEPDPFRGWKNFVTDKIEVHDLPGPHNMYLREPVVALLAQKLTASLESARQRFKLTK